MPDELDPQLLRAFAQADSAFPADVFVGAVGAAMQPPRRFALGARGLLDSVLGSLARGVLLPLRLPQTRLLTLGAAAMTLWAVFF